MSRRGRRNVPRTNVEAGPPMTLAELLRIPKDEDEWGGSASPSASSAATEAAAAAAGEQTKQKVLDKILSASHDTCYVGKRFVFPEELAIEPGDTRFDITAKEKEFLDNLKRIEKEERREKRRNSRFVMSSSSEDEDEEKAKAKTGTDVLCKQGGKKCRGVKDNGKCVCDPAYMEYRRWLIDMTSGEPRRSTRGGGGRGGFGGIRRGNRQ